VELKAVEVEVYEYRLKEIAGSIARFVIECSSGTYIRSLAHEMGKAGVWRALGGNHAHSGGEFSMEQAITLEELAEAKQAGKFADCLIPLESLLSNFPRVNVLPVVESACVTARNSTLCWRSFSRAVEPPPGATTQLDAGAEAAAAAGIQQQDKLIAIAEAVVPRTYQPIVVFEALP